MTGYRIRLTRRRSYWVCTTSASIGLFFLVILPPPISTLSLHDALPILPPVVAAVIWRLIYNPQFGVLNGTLRAAGISRSEEHTSELQSHHDIVCRLLLEKKKNTPTDQSHSTLTQCFGRGIDGLGVGEHC